MAFLKLERLSEKQLGIIIQTFVKTVVVENLRIIGCMSTAYTQVTMVL